MDVGREVAGRGADVRRGQGGAEGQTAAEAKPKGSDVPAALCGARACEGMGAALNRECSLTCRPTLGPSMNRLTWQGLDPRDQGGGVRIVLRHGLGHLRRVDE